MYTYIRVLLKITALFAMLLTGGEFLSHPEARADELQSQAMPAELNTAISYLLETVASQKEVAFDIEIVKPLIQYIKKPKQQDLLLYPDEKFGGTAAYYEYEINCDLEWILKLGYHPDLPGSVTSPSTVRFSYWKDLAGDHKPLPKMWQALQQDRLPLVVRAIEHEAITPNASTGAYYTYDQKRTLVVAKNDTHPVLISLSKQAGKSEVGRKGAVLGDDTDWTYVYSNQKGLTKRGMGWMDSYMYDASSITIFYQFDGDPGRVKAGVFKWLRAGWKNLNVVAKEDIHEGIERFAGTFKMILENPALQARYTEILQTVRQIQQLPDPTLRDASRQYFELLVTRYEDDNNLKRNDFDKLFVSPEYQDQLSRREMESILIVEYLKGVLGKPQLMDVPTLLRAG